MRLPTPALTAVTILIGGLTTSLILGSPYLVFGYHSPSLHLVLDSVDACVALLLTYLLHGRYIRSRRLQDLLLACGLFLLAMAGLGLTLLLDAFDELQPGTLDVWLPLVLRVTGAVLVVAAALVDRRPAPARWPWWARTIPAVLAVALLGLIVISDDLPLALEQSPPSTAHRPVITGHPVLLSAHGFTALCFFVASMMFTAQAVRRHDELLRWLGPACALAGFARVNYVLFPSLYSEWLYTGDLLRTGSYLLLLVGAAREINTYWSAQTQVAVLNDRRRLARELHDGVVQELGYIRLEARNLSVNRATSQRIIHACDTALDEARSAIDALGRHSDEPLGFVLHHAARQVAERYGGQVIVDVDDSVDVDQSQRHALVRITREAVSNAIRHGEAASICVQLMRDDRCRHLVVHDDGRGFDVNATSRNTGYGLTSMRERAVALPGSFELDSVPGEGTTVEVTW